jgi:oligopeptide transport system permease protein
MAARPGAVTALILLVMITLAAVLAPLLPLPAPEAINPELRAVPPGLRWSTWDAHGAERLASEHALAAGLRETLFGDSVLQGLLGTDALGRDHASRLVWGARVSLLVGLAATLVAMLIGVSWGLLAGLVGGRLDRIMMRLVDVAYAVPFLFIVILLIALLRGGPSSGSSSTGTDRLVLLFIAIGAISWLTMARVVRGQVLSLRNTEFVAAARALGASLPRIAWVHMLPNLRGLIAVYLTLTVPQVMLFEAFLSYLGLGVEPPGVSWGVLASEGMATLTAVGTSWWLVVFPSLALTLTLGSLNVIGDALRDALDPRRRA